MVPFASEKSYDTQGIKYYIGMSNSGWVARLEILCGPNLVHIRPFQRNVNLVSKFSNTILGQGNDFNGRTHI